VYINKLLGIRHLFNISINDTYNPEILEDPEISETMDIADHLVQLLVRTFCQAGKFSK
jgi:hypothetical protein